MREPDSAWMNLTDVCWRVLKLAAPLADTAYPIRNQVSALTLSATDGVATFVTAEPHQFLVGDAVVVDNADVRGYRGIREIFQVPNPTTFRFYVQPGESLAAVTPGTATARHPTKPQKAIFKAPTTNTDHVFFGPTPDANWASLQPGDEVVMEHPRILRWDMEKWHFKSATADQQIKVLYCPDTCADGGEPDGTTTLLDLFAYWRMEEDQLTRQDAHTGNYDLEQFGSTPHLPLTFPLGIPLAPGRIGSGALIQGSPGTQLENSNAGFGITGPMTMVRWVRFITYPASACFLMGKHDYATGTGYQLIVDATGKFVFEQGDGVDIERVVWPGNMAIWNFVVCGFDGVNQFIQLNEHTRIIKPGLTPGVATGPFQVGGWKHVLLPNFNHVADESGVWLNRALSVKDVAYLWNNGAGRTYPFNLLQI